MSSCFKKDKKNISISTVGSPPNYALSESLKKSNLHPKEEKKFKKIKEMFAITDTSENSKLKIILNRIGNGPPRYSVQLAAKFMEKLNSSKKMNLKFSFNFTHSYEAKSKDEEIKIENTFSTEEVKKKENFSEKKIKEKFFFQKKYQTKIILGKGSNSTVYLCKQRQNKKNYAVKKIKKSGLHNSNDVQNYKVIFQKIKQKNEIACLKKLKTVKGSIAFEDYLEDTDNIYIVMTFCGNITLEKYLKKKQNLLVYKISF